MEESTDKRAELLGLATLRQATRWPGYKCIGDYHAGAYECDFVSPYTKTAANVDAEIMVMLQDWSSDEGLSGAFDEACATLGHTPHLPTNRNLSRLLNRTFGIFLRDTYGTNLFPFVKLGGMSESIPRADLIKAARQFALPQIRIVNPKIVICLGLVTFNALREACDLRQCQTLSSAIESPFNRGTTRVWCQAHTGALGQNNRNKGGVDRVSDDWRRMKADVESTAHRVSQRSSGQRVIQATHSDTGRKVIKIASRARTLSRMEDKVNIFILNNKIGRNHREIYPLDEELSGFAIYDYDDKQARHAFNQDFSELRPGSIALTFGKDRKVRDRFRVTGTRKKYAPDIGQELWVIYGEGLDALVNPMIYSDFIALNRLTNPKLDANNYFRRGMLVAHLYRSM